MQIKHTLIHKSCWSPRIIADVSWEFFIIWIMVLCISFFLLFKVVYLGVFLVLTAFLAYLFARTKFKKDANCIKKFRKYVLHSNYYPAVSKYAVAYNTLSPKTYFHDERLIMVLFRKIINKKDDLNIKITEDYDNPYIKAKRVWMNYVDLPVNYNKKTMAMLRLSLIVIVILVFIIWKLATSYKVEAEVFLQTRNGTLAPITQVDRGLILSNPSIISGQLQDYVIALRTVTPDLDLLKTYQSKLNAMTDSTIYSSVIMPYIKQNAEYSGKVKIAVNISYIYPDGSYDSEKNVYKWVVLWDETAFNNNGDPNKVTYWRGDVTLGFFNPKNAETMRLNPTSILVERFDIHGMVANEKNSLQQQAQPLPANISNVYK